MREFVFAYGSLSAEGRATPLVPASLAGYERRWDVAMDNLETIPGYKFYVDPVSGERPALAITFLNIAPAPGVTCAGFLLALGSPGELVALDRRERNYDRIEVTDPITAAIEVERVWTYVAKAESVERFRVAAAAGRAVIQSAYIAAVETAYAAAGLQDAYDASTRAPTCPVRDLMRVNDSSRT